MNHLIASAVLAGYFITLTKMRYGYQVDYGADSQTYGSFKAASQAFKDALDHASELTYDQDMEQSQAASLVAWRQACPVHAKLDEARR